jgi:hypothetical protein
MRRSLALVLTVALVVLMAPNAALAQSATLEPPATPVGEQIAWLLDVSRLLPMSEAEAVEHFSPSLLAAAPVAFINAGLAAISGPLGLTLIRYDGDDTAARFLLSGVGLWIGRIRLDTEGRIDELPISAYLPAPATWEELDDRLAAVAPRTALLAAKITDGRCQPVHGVSPRRVMPLASGFKLYVLGALAHEVRRGEAGWDEPLAIRDDWKSLSSGEFQTFPAGTTLPLREYANAMISISDNTATDHLIGRLGRARVEAQQLRFAMAEAWRNAPFLTTRELFVLKLTDYPRLARTFERLPNLLQRLYLAQVVDNLPPPPIESAESWTTPRSIDTIEWFGSPADICRALAGLDRQAGTPGLEPVDQALSLNDGLLWLDPENWSQTWFKGGNEVGVLTYSYLARTGDETFVVSAMVSDPSAEVADSAGSELRALIRGAFALAAAIPAADIVIADKLPSLTAAEAMALRRLGLDRERLRRSSSFTPTMTSSSGTTTPPVTVRVVVNRILTRK